MGDEPSNRDDKRPTGPAEGVRIIGAEEAAEAIERGDAAKRRGLDLPRYGDRPPRPPGGARPAMRFPLDANADPSGLPSPVRPVPGNRAVRFDPESVPGELSEELPVLGDDPTLDAPRPATPPGAESPDERDDDTTNGSRDGEPWARDDVDLGWDSPNDAVAAWSRGATPAGSESEPEAEPANASWSDEFVGDEDDELFAEPPPAPAAAQPSEGGVFSAPDDDWDGSWDEPTGGLRWADDAVPADGAGRGAPDTPAPADDDVVDLSDPVDTATGAGAAASWPPDDDEWHEPPARAPLFDETEWNDWDEVVAEDPADDAWATFADRTDAGPDADAGIEPNPGEPTGHLGAEEPDPGADDEDPAVAPGWVDEPVPVPAPAPRRRGLLGRRLTAPAPQPDPVLEDGPGQGDPGPAAEPAAASGAPVFDFGDEPSGQVELPHWTAPATGEIPRVLVDSDSDDDPAAADWVASSATPSGGARWRDQSSDWGHDGFDDIADPQDERVGAMDESKPTHDEIYNFDELDEFDGPAAEPAIPDEPRRRVAPPRPSVSTPVTSGLGGAGARTGRSGRDLVIATGVGVGVALVALFLFRLGAKFALAFVVLIVVAAMGELMNALRRAGYRPATLLATSAAVAYPLAVYWKGLAAFPLLLVLTVIATLVWHLVGADGDARVVESSGVTLFGVGWIAGLGSFAALLLSLPDGVGMLLTAVVATVAYDVGGLAVGRTVGRRPLSDASPNKTVEGLVGGMLFTVIVTTIVFGVFKIAPFDSPGAALSVGLFAALAAPLGDLCESLVKRDLGVKDMSTALPGHGGVLDRFDALLFVLPAVFYAAVFFELGPFG